MSTIDADILIDQPLHELCIFGSRCSNLAEQLEKGFLYFIGDLVIDYMSINLTNGGVLYFWCGQIYSGGKIKDLAYPCSSPPSLRFR